VAMVTPRRLRAFLFSLHYCHLTLVAGHVESQPENPFSKLVAGQEIAVIPEFELESGVLLRNVPVAYKTWGKLNAERSNVMIICHALSGSADVEDW
jgi:homoserine O-acetyltransferase/O-succinyltransferase